jgi:hypothetical protein
LKARLKSATNLSIEESGKSFHVLLRDRGSDSLQKIFSEFAGYVRAPSTFPEFENTNLLAKYYVTTTAVALANGRR